MKMGMDEGVMTLGSLLEEFDFVALLYNFDMSIFVCLVLAVRVVLSNFIFRVNYLYFLEKDGFLDALNRLKIGKENMILFRFFFLLEFKYLI